MGCVLGKPASRDRQSREASSDRGRSSDEPPVDVTGSVNAAVKAKREKAAPTTQKQNATRHTGDFPAVDVQGTTERRRPRPEVSLCYQQGWPSWLMAVAGDAIGEWTPRRANTFEKLDKVIKETKTQV